GTLRNAILRANVNAQDNTILLASGTYNLTPAAGGQLVLAGANHALTIQGTGQTIISAGGTSRVTDVLPGVQLTLAALTITGGLATDGGSVGGPNALGGGLLNSGGNVTLRAVTVASNTAQASAGADALGGGIYSNGALTILSSIIAGNQARGGAGVA